MLGAKAQLVADNQVAHLLFDSRKVFFPDSSLFIALKGVRRDGHHFIPELYKKGVRNFIVCTEIETSEYPGANFLFVNDGLKALQKLATFHRKQFSIPVIGITGSNGKTMVKEWLYQLLHKNFNIVRSPKSYNSQIGVPVSVWELNKQHTLGIFEAGISQSGEMDNLNEIIQPTIGILTNIEIGTIAIINNSAMINSFFQLKPHIHRLERPHSFYDLRFTDAKMKHHTPAGDRIMN